MTHKLLYGITKERKLAYYDALIILGQNANIDDIIYGNLKQVILQTTADLNEGKRVLPNKSEIMISYELIETVKIPKEKAVLKGEKGIFICTNSQYTGLLTACKTDNYIRQQLGDKLVSFEQFIDNIVNAFLTMALTQALNKKMDDERNALKAETKKSETPITNK